MKKLPIGRDNFKDIIEGNFYYVDKTKMLEELLERGSYVTLFPRPRRFGKSLMISTIDEFFNVEKKQENRNLFKGLYIEKSKYKKEQGQYPVIKLNFKSLQSNNWKEMYEGITLLLQNLYLQFYDIKDEINEIQQDRFYKVLKREAGVKELEQSLLFLSQLLYEKYGKKVILLIDEYDVPIQSGYLNGYYTEIIGFIKNLFGNTLKTNDNVKFAVMTGVLRVSKESIFSDLNNVDVYSILDQTYDEYFGFSEEETKKMLEEFNMILKPEVKNMYDGYLYGNKEIYNPWSIINYISRKELLPFWVNTGGNELIRRIISQTEEPIKVEIEKLIEGKSIKCDYNEKITFLDLNEVNSINNILNFLLVSGYLTITRNSDLQKNEIEVKIPNKEIRSVYLQIIKTWFEEQSAIIDTQLKKLKANMLENNIEAIEENLNKILQHISFTDTKENFYHGYMLGLFVEFLRDDYIVKSNREAGQGRFDIMIESVDRKIGFIIEFKIANDDENIEKKAKEGYEQIKEKEYYKELVLDKVENIKNYSIAFQRKKCKVIG